jgi:hypothetical protein
MRLELNRLFREMDIAELIPPHCLHAVRFLCPDHQSEPFGAVQYPSAVSSPVPVGLGGVAADTTGHGVR